jgi:hypothetical protein
MLGTYPPLIATHQGRRVAQCQYMQGLYAPYNSLLGSYAAQLDALRILPRHCLWLVCSYKILDSFLYFPIVAFADTTWVSQHELPREIWENPLGCKL